MKKIAFILLFFPSTAFALPVIQDAPFSSGFGIDTTAGAAAGNRATADPTICHVNSLNDDGSTETDQTDREVSGTLRYCLEDLQPTGGSKVIVFDVSGTIDLSTPITIGGALGVDAETKGSYITIAGQTAPSPGITIKDETLLIQRNSHDILIQHIRFRLGEAGSQAADYKDAVTLDNHYVEGSETPPYNIVFDHCSLSWAVDEIMETGADNATYIDCIFSEGLMNSLHGKGNHSKGLHFLAYNYGTTGNQNAIVLRSIFTHYSDRGPDADSGSIVIANNVMYDFWRGVYFDDIKLEKGPVKSSFVGNYMAGTDQTVTYLEFREDCGVNAASRFFIDTTNYWNGSIQTDPWSAVTMNADFYDTGSCSESVSATKRAATAADAIPLPGGYTPLSAADARTYALANAGARPWDRDTVDTRIISEVTAASGTSAMIDTVSYTNADCTGNLLGPGGITLGCCTGAGTGTCRQNTEAGWPALAENTAAWTVPDNPNGILPSGYTNLEQALYEATGTQSGGEPPPPVIVHIKTGTDQITTGTNQVNISQ